MVGAGHGHLHGGHDRKRNYHQSAEELDVPGSKVTFTWTAETGATSYQLWIGNTPGAHDVASGGTSSLSLTFSGLPTDGRQLYVTLYGYSGGVWTVQDTATYTAFH